MIPYILLAISPLVLSVFFPQLNEKEKLKRKYLILCGIILILFMGLRSKYVGSVDTSHYYNMMERALPCNSWQEYYRSDYVEGGFQFFVYCLSRVFDSSYSLIFVSSVIFVITVLYCIYKNSDNVVLSTVMYITLGLMQFEMQGMRQAIAMAIGMVSFEFVKKRKMIPFILLVLVAIQVHRTAVVLVAIYVISFLSYNMWTLLLLAIGSGVVFYYSDTLMNFANEIFETDYTQSIDSGGFVATAIYILIILFAMLFNRKIRYQKEDKTQSTIMLLTIVGMVSYVMRYVGVGISERISYYFMFGQLLLFPNTISVFKQEQRKIINIAIYMLCIGLFIYRLNGSNFIPYEFFWS